MPSIMTFLTSGCSFRSFNLCAHKHDNCQNPLRRAVNLQNILKKYNK